jgi:hypothetical protein
MTSIPTQRTSDEPQNVQVSVTISVNLRIEAQRAELHLDLDDRQLTEMAMNAVRINEAKP